MTATLLLLGLLAILAVTVAGYVVWPLLRPAPVDAADAVRPDDPAVGRAVLRERRRELEAALAHLPADAPERRAALAEFADQADAELQAASAAGTVAAAAAPRRGLAALVAAATVAPAFALYLFAGTPEAVSPELRAPREPATLEELVADLRRRLERDPGAMEGWRMLGRAEMARGQFDDAREAFERALALAPDDATAKVDLADAIAQAQGAVLEGRPIELVREALAIDPRHPKALGLAGAYEVTRRNFPAAIAHWQALVAVLPPDSAQARQIAGFVADLQAGRMPQVAATADAGTVPPAAPARPAGPAASAGAVAGRVEVERRLAPTLRPDDTLFVVARALDAEGRPAGPPLAVLRARGADLPLVFSLDDTLAMSPAARLSALPAGAQVVVIARLTRTGEAQTRAGDRQGASTPVAPGTTDVRVLIDTVLE